MNTRDIISVLYEQRYCVQMMKAREARETYRIRYRVRIGLKQRKYNSQRARENPSVWEIRMESKFGSGCRSPV